MNEADGAPADRIVRLLDGLDLAHGTGLEFGPLAHPILPLAPGRHFSVDHLPTPALRDKYRHDPAVDIDAIAEIDIVWAEGPLLDAIAAASPGPQARFDHVVASHVIEHVPDLVRWFAELRSALTARGAVRLIVPDRRFTMDVARRESTIADALAAHAEARTVPRPREILDFYCNYRVIDRAHAWAGIDRGADGIALEHLPLATRLANEALAGHYRDVHVWVFTPSSFARLMGRLAEIGKLGFACRRLYPTRSGEIDFFVHLEACDDRERLAASWHSAEAACCAGPVLPQDDPPALLRRIERLDRDNRDLLEALAREAAAAETARREAEVFRGELAVHLIRRHLRHLPGRLVRRFRRLIPRGRGATRRS